MRNKYLLIIAIAFLSAIITSCTDTTSGGETLNEKIALYMPDGITPAVDAKVKFFSIGDTSATPIHQTQTNAEGKYSTSGVTSTGYYNVIAEYEDSLFSMQDTVFISQESNMVKDDTLNNPGSISGIVALQPKHSHLLNNVYVNALGMGRAVNIDSSGWFTMTKLAPGDYDLQVDTDIENYGPKFVNINIASGINDTISDTIVLPYSGIPIVTGLTHTYDTLKGIATLHWSPSSYGDISNYLIYRKSSDSLDWSETQIAWTSSNDSTFQDTIFHGGTADDTDTYNFDYSVVIMDNGSNKGPKYKYISVNAISPVKVTSTINVEIYNKTTGLIADTISTSDSAAIFLSVQNNTRPYKSITWSIGHINSIVKQKQFIGEAAIEHDTLSLIFPTEDNFKIYTTIEDLSNTVWIDSSIISVWNKPKPINLFVDSIFAYTVNLRWNKSNEPKFSHYTVTTEIDSIIDTTINISNINDTVLEIRQLRANSKYNFKINVKNMNNISSIKKNISSNTTSLWSEIITSVPTPRYVPSACIYNNKLYVIGGWSNAIEAFDLSLKTWEIKSPIPSTKTITKLIPLDNKIYVLMGQMTDENNNINSGFDIYDIKTDSWIVLDSSSKIKPITPFLSGTDIYAFFSENNNQTSLEKYEFLNNQWKIIHDTLPLPENLSMSAITSFYCKFYQLDSNAMKTKSFNYKYDISLNTFELISENPLSTGFFSTGPILNKNSIYEFAYHYSDQKMSFMAFDTINSQWNKLESLGEDISGTLVSHDDEIILIETGDGSKNNNIYIYNIGK